MFKSFNVLVLLVGLLLMGLISVQAQEATPEADNVVVVTDVATPDGVTYAADTGNTIIYLVIALVGIVTGFGVGTASGIAGALAFIKRLNTNDNVKLAIEQLAMSLPGNTLHDVRSLIELARQGVNFADEVTDGRLENGESITLSRVKFSETPEASTAPDVYRE